MNNVEQIFESVVEDVKCYNQYLNNLEGRFEVVSLFYHKNRISRAIALLKASDVPVADQKYIGILESILRKADVDVAEMSDHLQNILTESAGWYRMSLDEEYQGVFVSDVDDAWDSRSSFIVTFHTVQSVAEESGNPEFRAVVEEFEQKVNIININPSVNTDY